MTPVEIAWVAGIIEGEGSIALPKNSSAIQHVRICVAMTDEDVIRRLHEVTGMGSVLPRKKNLDHHKDQWQWNVGRRRDVARLLCAIAPVMGERRRLRITEAAERLGLPPRFGVGATGRPPGPINHGTYGGAQAHQHRGEKPCEACRLARNSYMRARDARKKVAQ